MDLGDVHGEPSGEARMWVGRTLLPRRDGVNNSVSVAALMLEGRRPCLHIPRATNSRLSAWAGPGAGRRAGAHC